MTVEANAGAGIFFALRGHTRMTAESHTTSAGLGLGYRNDRVEVQGRVVRTGFEIGGPGSLHGTFNGHEDLSSVFAGVRVRRFLGRRWAASVGSGVLLIGDSLEKNRARGLGTSIAASLILGNRHASGLLTLEQQLGHFRSDLMMATTLSLGARWR